MPTSQLCFYWIIDGSRRRSLNLTLICVTFFLGLGSEVLQRLLPNGRVFDPYDILANSVGSMSALALCSWYHKRMLERRRLSKYHIVPGDDLGQDVELGGTGGSRQGSGITGSVGRSLEEQVDNWDEHADDPWDEEVALEEEGHGTESGSGEGGLTPSSGSAGDDGADGKK